MTVIQGDSLHLDFSDYEDEDNNKVELYKRLKPKSMSFVKCRAKSLHYAI